MLTPKIQFLIIAYHLKLLRVLQEKEVELVGGRMPRKIDFRFICATNRNIEKLLSSGEFRMDLFYRINVMNLTLPPLRTIKGDIPLFFKAFLSDLSEELKQTPKPVAPEAMVQLQTYPWPGNMRELRNIAERALIVANGDAITLAERQAIARALSATGNNRAAAARALGIHRTGLYQKMKKHGLTP